MEDSIDCIIIGSVNYSVNERIVTADKISKQCCRRQYVKVEKRKFFYYQLIDYIYEKNNSNKRFCINEVCAPNTLQMINYLGMRHLKVELINNFDSEKERLKMLLSKNAFTVVLSLGQLYSSLPIIRIVKYIRKYNDKINIIVSGNYIYNKWATSDEDEFKRVAQMIAANYYVVNVLEKECVYKLIQQLKEGTEVKISHGIYNVDMNYTQIADACKEQEDLSVTYFDALDTTQIPNMAYVNTSVGCKARCSFCNYPIKNKTYRIIAGEAIEDILCKLQALGVEYISFYDDSFNLPREHFVSICKMIQKNKFTFKWFAYCRLKELQEKDIKLLKESNCMGIYTGIESANDDILFNMNKGTTKKDLSNKLDLLDKYGIIVFAFLLVGFPGETSKTIKETVDFINQNSIAFYTANLWYADVSTPIYNRADELGLEGKDFQWSHNTMTSEEASKWTDYILLNVKNAVWVPNECFGFQGVVYFLSQGFSIETIKKILIHIRELVKNNIFNIHEQDNRIIGELKALLK